MIQVLEKSQCCGCGACVQKCPKKCIDMIEDEEGFLYPKIDISKCIECGVCENVCPILNIEGQEYIPLKSYAAYNLDKIERMQSSSGGVFSILSREILNRDGVVFGAHFTFDYEVEHIYVKSVEELEQIRGAKYVQSKIGNTYCEVENFLKKGIWVLFSGTPCQISGLRFFLKKKYDNLITVEIVCHGVPSPLVWRKYLRELKQQKKIDRFERICFRDKSTGWKHYSFSVDYYSKGKKRNMREFYTQNLYMKGFIQNLFLRPSCYSCSFKSLKSQADFSLGDFWGIQHVDPEIDDDKGLTALLVNNEKGFSFLKSLDIQTKEFHYKNVISGNPSLIKSTALTEKRFLFYETFYKDNRRVSSIISDLTRLPFVLSFKIWLCCKIKNIIRK